MKAISVTNTAQLQITQGSKPEVTIETILEVVEFPGGKDADSYETNHEENP
jgi:hypothetical protein